MNGRSVLVSVVAGDRNLRQHRRQPDGRTRVCLTQVDRKNKHASGSEARVINRLENAVVIAAVIIFITVSARPIAIFVRLPTALPAAGA